MARETLDWQHKGKDYQVRVEGKRILWMAVHAAYGDKRAWRRLQSHGDRAKLCAEACGLIAPGW